MSIDSKIQQQLEPVLRRQQRVGLLRKLASCWAVGALMGLGLLLLERQSGWSSALGLPVIGLLTSCAAIVTWVRHGMGTPVWSEVASQIEGHHPELGGRLITAIQQQPGAGGELNYLQQRLILQTLEYARRTSWRNTIPQSRLRFAEAANWLALMLFASVLIGLRNTGGYQLLLSRTFADGIAVTPGDTSLERGSSLVVLARFKGMLPPKVDLVFGQPATLQRIPLIKSLGDPLFGGSVPEVVTNFVYHVEYGGQSTRDYTVTVFEHPRLERADADVTFPGYTGRPHKRIENTRRLSAVEGSQLDLALQFNKPVSSARLVARDKERSAVPLSIETGRPSATLKQFRLESSKTYDLQLVDSDGRTNKVPAEFVFEALKNRPPEMRLTMPRGDLRPSPLEEIPFEGTVWDDFGVQAFGVAYAVNGQNPNFIELGRNVPGNEKKAFQHLLRLEDLGVQPDELVSWFVWADDLGPDGQPRRTMGDLYFGEVRPFEEVFREGQGMEGQAGGGQSGGEDQTGRLADLEKQIVNATWRLQREHSSAPSKTPERKVPVRRGSEQPSDQSQNSALPAEQFPNKHGSFAALPRVAAQIAATDEASSSDLSDEPRSKPRRAPGAQLQSTRGQAPKYEDDAVVVLDSQAQALEQAMTALQRQRDPQAAGLWQKAVTEMEAALARLQAATNSPAALKDALAAEQAAYQALVRLQAHEYQVSRARNRNQGGSSRNQQMQRQLEEMDLTQSENRYETQREAPNAQNPEKREQLQIMSRLQELARRQQDLNQRLKELQTALQEARTEQERREVQRQLKRLQEEEQQMLADVDEVRQRMERPENQSRLAEERRQLDQTRQEVERASEAAGQGAASQALAAGSRAQSQLQQLRDQIRKKNSSQFADDMRDMRNQARELARQQDEILKKIQAGDATDRKSLSASGDQEETRSRLARQKELMTNLVERATQVSQQAEEAEPLLAHQLYDTVRKFTQDTAKDLKEAESDLLNRGPMTRSLFDLLRDNSEQGAVKLEEITSEMLRLGFLPQAGRVGERARSGIEGLKKGVERAAESVLGDDTEALRLAERQLDDLANQLQREIAAGQGRSFETNASRSGTGATSDKTTAGDGRPSTNQTPQALASNQNGDQPQSSGQGQPNAQPGDSQQTSSSRDGQSQGSGKQPGSATDATASNGGNQPDSSAQDSSLAGGANRSQQRNDGRTPGQGSRSGSAAGGDYQAAEAGGGGGGARNWNWNNLLTENARRQSDPITGEDFANWSDGLRDVEEMIDQPDLRDDLAKARERARLVRQEFKRDRKKPDWAVVQLQVMKPLTEVRDRIADELARRQSREALVPLDRDPVPNRYSELVRRYYEELGKEK